MVDAAAMVKALKLTELVPSQTGFLPIEASDPIRQPISTGAKYFCRMRR